MAEERLYRKKEEESKSEFWKTLVESELILEGIKYGFLIDYQGVYAYIAPSCQHLLQELLQDE